MSSVLRISVAETLRIIDIVYHVSVSVSHIIDQHKTLFIARVYDYLQRTERVINVQRIPPHNTILMSILFQKVLSYNLFYFLLQSNSLYLKFKEKHYYGNK